MIISRLKGHPITLQVPLGAEEKFGKVVDLVHGTCWHFTSDSDTGPQEIPVPDEEKERVDELRQALIARLAEYDDDIMMAYLEGHDISSEEIAAAVRRVTLANKAVPVLCGSALKNMGVQPLLDAIVDYLPSPLEVPPVEGIDPKTDEKVVRQASDDEPFAALAFKVVTDAFVGRLVYFRVYSGRLKVGAQVYNSTKGRPERIGRLLLMHANHREDIEVADAGAIVATLGLKNTFTGDTLTQSTSPVILETIRFPEPDCF